MATSSAMSTSNQYIKYKITVTQNSQNIANNTSNVTVSVNFYRTNTGYTSYGTGTVYCKINGTTYTASVTPSQKITSSGIVLFKKTLDIKHATDGKKELTCSAWIKHDVVTSSEQSYKQPLTTIPRKSTLSVANGTLGTAQTLTVTRQSSSFTHSIKAVCGGSTLYIKADGSTSTSSVKHSDCSIPFTPPLSWASQNTSGTSVSVKYTITTYNGSTSIGSEVYTKTCSIPSSVKPSCSIALSDATGYAEKYGFYIVGLSKFKVVVTPTTAYGSPIASYSTTANGSTYTTASFTTGVLAGEQTEISATVKDKRGRSGSATKSFTYLNYSAPKISKLTVGRCDKDGTANNKGEYVKVTFSGSVTNLGYKNSARYKVYFKKSSASSYTLISSSNCVNTFVDYTGDYSVSNASYIFAAETGSSYDVKLEISDDFKTVPQKTSVSTAFTLMHFSADGTGLGIGKVAEEENLLDIGIPVRFREGVVQNVLWDGAYYMNAGQTVDLTNSPISKQPNGVVLVFCRYINGVAEPHNYNSFFIPKMLVALEGGRGSAFHMNTVDYAYICSKYLYIHDTAIGGNANNETSGTKNGITYANNAYVLRYVIGV